MASPGRRFGTAVGAGCRPYRDIPPPTLRQYRMRGGVDQPPIPSVPPFPPCSAPQAGGTLHHRKLGNRLRRTRKAIGNFRFAPPSPLHPKSMSCGRIASDRSEGNFFKLPSVSREAGFRVVRSKSRGDCPLQILFSFHQCPRGNTPTAPMSDGDNPLQILLWRQSPKGTLGKLQ